MALPSLRNLWTFARQVDDLFTLHKKVEASLEAIEGRLRHLEDRMLKLETEQGRIFTEARNAATVMASGVISDAVTRLTRLEVRTEQLEQRRLSQS